MTDAMHLRRASNSSADTPHSYSLRASMNSEDLEEDRRLIMKKIQQHKSMRDKSDRQAGGSSSSSGGGGGRRRLPSVRSHDASEVTGDYDYEHYDHDDGHDDYADDDDDDPSRPDEDLLLLHEVREWHEQDEKSIGGRMEDGQEEGLEAMTRALTNHPVAWWEMRKQWQKRRGAVMNLVGGGGGRGGGGGGVGTPSSADGGDVAHGDASTARRAPDGRGWPPPAPSSSSVAADVGVVGHPIMLEDPSSIGYDVSSSAHYGPGGGGAHATSASSMTMMSSLSASRDHRQQHRRRVPAVMYVSRDYVQKRRALQGLYIIASVSVVCLFMFVLGQRKLSNYAMVDSPLSLSAYLEGEELMSSEAAEPDAGYDYNNYGGNGGGELGGMGDQAAFPQQPAELGDIEVNPVDPLANEVLANDPLVGNHIKKPDAATGGGENRLEQLKRVIVGRGITPEGVFANPSTAQYRALDWLANDDVLRYKPDSERWARKIVQRYTLATIYYATNGHGWKNTLFFLSNRDECDWNRVYMGYFSGAGRCNKEGYITALALWGNYLQGGLPPEVGSLTSLRMLSVFDNKIAIHPPESLVKLTSVKRLYLQKNAFEGDVNFLCQLKIPDLRADCGERGRVLCPCCIACGYNEKNDKGNMLDRFISR